MNVALINIKILFSYQFIDIIDPMRREVRGFALNPGAQELVYGLLSNNYKIVIYHEECENDINMLYGMMSYHINVEYMTLRVKGRPRSWIFREHYAKILFGEERIGRVIAYIINLAEFSDCIQVPATFSLTIS